MSNDPAAKDGKAFPQKSAQGSTQESAGQREQRTGALPPDKLKPFAIAMGIAVLAASLGDISLKKGVQNIQAVVGMNPGKLAVFVEHAVTDVWLLAGIALMIIHFTAFVKALKMAALSLVVPLRSASYILTTLLAQYFLHENVTGIRWLAVLVILVGVSMVGRSAEPSEGQAGASGQKQSAPASDECKPLKGATP